MKLKSFILIFIMISYLSIDNIFAQTNWFFDNQNSHINTAIIDSITYMKKGNCYFQNLWYDGKVIDKSEILEGDSFNPKEISLEYDYSTLEEDGMDGILTKSGFYAVFTYTPDSTGFVFINGDINRKTFSCLLTDSLGYVRGVKTSDNRFFLVMYSPNELSIVDSEGNIVTVIPYSEFDKGEEMVKTKRRDYRKAWEFTRSPIYQVLSIGHTIKQFVKEPLITASLEVLYYLSKGKGLRYGTIITKLISLGFDSTDLFAWIEFLEKMEEAYYFGNAKLTALDAIEQDPCCFITPCKVEGLNDDVFRKMQTGYEELVDYSYKLNMSVQTASFPNKEKQTIIKKIDKDGTYTDFIFNFNELQTLYDYEPSLTLDVTMRRPSAEFDGAIVYYVNPNDKNRYDIKHKRCTIYGKPNSLITGSVSSTIDSVNNVKSTSADVICSFSKIPSGAECGVIVYRKGTDIQLIYPSIPGKDSHIVKVSNLSMNTSYVATTFIKFNGKTYEGIKSVEFKTSGPSGTVISVNNVTDKSAVAKCIFSEIESGGACGVIAKSSTQTLTFPASTKEGEQSVFMSGLTPSTKYQCYAYIMVANHYQEQKNGIGFTTDPPDLSGTWNCTSYTKKGTVYETWTITLNEGGSGSASNGSSTYNDFHWEIGAGGTVIFRFFLINQSSGLMAYNSRSFQGVVNDLNNPTSISGKGQYNQGNAIVDNYSEFTFVMTR